MERDAPDSHPHPIPHRGPGFVLVALQACGILWCVRAELRARRKGPGRGGGGACFHAHQKRRDVLISEAAPKHLTRVSRGSRANICIHSELVHGPRKVGRATLPHPPKAAGKLVLPPPRAWWRWGNISAVVCTTLNRKPLGTQR